MPQPHHLLQNARVPYYAYRISLTKQVIQKCVVALDVFSLRQQRKATYSLGKKLSSTHLSWVHVLHYLLPDPALPLQNFICSGHRTNGLISLFSPLFVFLHHPNLMLNAALFTWLEVLLRQFSQVNLVFIWDAILEEGKAIILLCMKSQLQC